MKKVNDVLFKVEENSQKEKIEFGVSYGDIFKVSNDAYIMCADCTISKNISKLLYTSGFGSFDLVITSPPYAEQRINEYGGVKEIFYTEWWGSVQDCIKPYIVADGNLFLNIKPHVRKDSQRSLYVFDLVTEMVRRWGWKFIDEFCWLKTSMPKQVIKRFKNAFEPVYQFSLSENFRFYPKNVMIPSESTMPRTGAGTGSTTWSSKQGKGGALIKKDIIPGMAYPSNVIKAQQTKSYGHEATFPITLVDFFVKAYSQKGDVVYDPFGGSGTTGVSAILNGRRTLIVEKQERYVEIILNRFNEECNMKAELVK